MASLFGGAQVVSVEGQLLVSLRREESGLQVAICSTRPLEACKSFVGKGSDYLVDTLPLLYSICGQAQRTAAVAALEAARGMAPDVSIAVAREILVLAETAREHAWRILLDWPVHWGERPQPEQLAPLVGIPKRLSNLLFQRGLSVAPPGAAARADGDGIAAIFGDLERALADAIFGIAPADFFGLEDRDRLFRWQRDQATPAARMLELIGDLGWDALGAVPLEPMPELGLAELESRLGGPEADRFIALPEWDGLPRETTPRTRQARHPLLAEAEVDGLRGRFLALLLELAWIPQRLQELLAVLSDFSEGGGNALEGSMAHGSAAEIGIGVVEAARGRLVHRVALDSGVVREYQILAPTEWNFHPRGPAALALATLSPESDDPTLERQARLLIHAIDPCVGFRLTIE